MSTGRQSTTTLPERAAEPSSLLVPLAEARRRIDRWAVTPIRGRTTPVRAALGAVSASSVRASRSEPPHDVAAMDGYAIRFSPGRTASEYRLQRGLITPGARPPPLAAGHAIAITTGAPLPPHADAVVRKERSRPDRESVRVRGALRRGTDVHSAGEDLRTGDEILTVGERLRPYHLALLVAQGIGAVRIRRARIAVLPIGDELTRRPNRGEGEVVDSISPLIAALAPAADCLTGPALADRRHEIARAIVRATDSADLIVTIGGTSVGPKDFVKSAVASIGTLLFEGVRVNVLKRAAVGEVRGVPVVMLPGQVVAAVVAWHEHGLRVLSRLLGCELVRWETVRLATRLVNRHPMDSVYLFRVRNGRAWPCRWGVRLYSELLGSNAWGVVPRHTTLPKGTALRVQGLQGSR